MPAIHPLTSWREARWTLKWFRVRTFHSRQQIDWCRDQVNSINGYAGEVQSHSRQLVQQFRLPTQNSVVSGDTFEIYLGPPKDRYTRRLSVLSGLGRLREAGDGTCIELRLMPSQWAISLLFLGMIISLLALVVPTVSRWLGMSDTKLSHNQTEMLFVGPFFLVIITAILGWELWDDAYRDFIVRGLRAREVDVCPASNGKEQKESIA